MTIKISWRALIDAKIIKRTDNGMAIRLDAIRLVENFNLRDTTAPDYQEDMDALFAHMSRGGKVPALEVVLSADGQGVDVVEGHRRTLTYRRLVESGQPVEWVRIEPFEGNNIERVARIMTSQEGRKLKPLEVAEGYRRLAAFNLGPEEIARRVCKTRQHVDQMLILANADHDVQRAVADGIVSATTAVDVTRKHGSKAGDVIAEAASKGKVTAGKLKPWTPPVKVVAPVVDAVQSLLDGIDNEDRARIESAAEPSAFNDTFVSVNARELLDLFKAFNAIGEARDAAAMKLKAKEEKAKQLELAGSEGA